jgi:hypothetical protein
MLLMDRRQPLGGESIGHLDQRRPQSPGDERHLPIDEPCADEIGRVGKTVDRGEDGMTRG